MSASDRKFTWGTLIESPDYPSRSLYLTTVDENIAGNAIEDMASFGVILVIPESLKKAKETEYEGHENVLSFREFCDVVVGPAMAFWLKT